MENINVGATANNGLGDNLRNSFIKVNSNFTEVTTSLSNKTNLGHTHSINDIIGLRNELDIMGDNIELLQISLSDYTGDLTSINNQIFGLTTSNIDLNNRVSAIEASFTSINNSIASINSAIIDINIKITDLQNN